jgi:hypothetical protein
MKSDEYMNLKYSSDEDTCNNYTTVYNSLKLWCKKLAYLEAPNIATLAYFWHKYS